MNHLGWNWGSHYERRRRRSEKRDKEEQHESKYEKVGGPKSGVLSDRT